MRVEVSGASDDLVEVEGDIREEFNALTNGTSEENGDDGGLLAFSNGALLRIAYTRDGVWRITPLSLPQVEGNTFNLTQAPANDESNYSDRAVIEAPSLSWVVFGNEWAKASG